MEAGHVEEDIRLVKVHASNLTGDKHRPIDFRYLQTTVHRSEPVQVTIDHHTVDQRIVRPVDR